MGQVVTIVLLAWVLILACLTACPSVHVAFLPVLLYLCLCVDLVMDWWPVQQLEQAPAPTSALPCVHCSPMSIKTVRNH